MQDRLTFKYAIIRLVPKVEREEFFNIGVILFCKRTKFLDVKFEINPDKLKAFSHELELEELNKYLEVWKLICKGETSSGPIGQLDLSERFGWLAACRSTIIQSSITHSGLTLNPQEELDKLFKMNVL